MANVELIMKATEKRLSALERSVDSLLKTMQQLGTAALEKRTSSLETIVQALAAASKAGPKQDSTRQLEAMIFKHQIETDKELKKTLRTW